MKSLKGMKEFESYGDLERLGSLSQSLSQSQSGNAVLSHSFRHIRSVNPLFFDGHPFHSHGIMVDLHDLVKPVAHADPCSVA
jgi:prepilin-type processing-associated H-X9-DG protein